MQKSLNEFSQKQCAYEEKEQNAETRLALCAGEAEMQQLKIRGLERKIETGEASLALIRKNAVELEDTLVKNEELKADFENLRMTNETKLFNLSQGISESRSMRKETERLAQKLQLTLRNSEKENQLNKEHTRKELEEEAAWTEKVRELEKTLGESLRKEEKYEKRMQEINGKVSEFSNLMDKLIEENEKLKTEIEFESKMNPLCGSSESNFFKRTHQRAFPHHRSNTMEINPII